MSIIIRLQNLPLCAKSGDIRNFFGGLHIPDGGVHILGGEKGDAFIAFLSDEDARLAMRKDGGKIKDTRVKLFLSSRMEMQHEVEKITKCNIGDTLSHKTLNATCTSEVEVNRCRSFEMKRHSYNQSSHKHNDWSIDKSRSINEYCQRSRSPIGDRIHGSREYLKRRSRSPKRYLPSQRSPPSKSRTFIQRKRSVSPKASSYALEVGSHSGWKNVEHSHSEDQSLSQSQLQAELEKRITEELEKNYVFSMVMGDKKPPECNMSDLNVGVREYLPCGVPESYQQRYSIENIQQDLMSFLSTSSNVNQFQDNFKPNLTVNRSQPEKLSFSHSEVFRSNSEKRVKTDETFYATLSGLDQLWNFREIQMMLKGIFAPQNHIRFERDHAGYKTGIAFVKLTNKEDFDSILRRKSIFFNGFEVKVSECPDSLHHNYFPSQSKIENVPQNQDFCYTLKGLPFTCTYDAVVNFFHGFEIADILIIYGQDGRATGTGFVSFSHRKDFEGALSQNGKKILHRYIEMLPCTDKEMAEAIKAYSNPSYFTPYSKLISDRNLPATRRPLCALLTGLPLNTTTKKIATFFSESGLRPDAIHLTLNKKKLSDGRAFVEFTNFLDFDLALKFHGKQLDNNVICVKQILYDEMVKILDSQKAQHFFETPVPTVPVSSVPEKVPYLWEPPDATEEQEKVQVGNSSRDYKDEPSFDYEVNRLQGRLNNSTYSSKDHEDHIIPNKNIPIDTYFDSHDNKEIFTKATDTLSFAMIPNNADLNPSEKRANVEGSVKESTQISVNNNFNTNIKASELFNSLKKYEDNIKVSRLSPENEAALLEFLKNRKVSPPEISDRRSKSPDRRGRNSNREESLDRGKREHKNDKFYKLRSVVDSRNRNERDSKQHEDWKSDPHRRSPFQLGRNENRSRGCVVYLSNVSISVCTQDLLEFFHGFDFYEDTLNRRYTIGGEPTHDVRVTFFNRREAERAIRILNKRYLQNMPVSMFIM